MESSHAYFTESSDVAGVCKTFNHWSFNKLRFVVSTVESIHLR